MTAIVAGQGLGLFNTSANVLGGDSGQIGVASQGRSGEKVVVNASTGNLLVQQQDEWLVGRGQDVGLLRTYNSLATGDGDNNDNWRLGWNRKVNATSTTAASVTRIGEDGVELTYSNINGKFVNKDGSGSFDTLTWDATSTQWVWEDGNTHVKEYYQAVGSTTEYRLVKITDAGNSAASVTITYDPTSGLITGIATAGGELMELTYEAAAVAGKKPHIKSVQLKSTANATVAYNKRVTYDYDPQDRLKKVWVDLSPTDLSTADGKVYWTEYTYIDTTSNRLKTLKQSDDSQLEFHYDASNRIDWIKESLITGGEVRQTSFTYLTGAASAGNTTQITDASGNVTELTYVNTAGASYGQIQSIKRPMSGASLPTASFTYDADGNVLTSTDARGNKTTYRYDGSGNNTYQEDAQGNVTERTYNSANMVLTEIVYSNRDTDMDGGASGALTTRYLYDATYPTRLRFMISPEGRVTQYTYNGLGQRTSAIQYSASAYTGLVQDFGVNTTGLTTSPAFVLASNQLQYTASTAVSTASISTTDASALGTLWSMEVSTPAAGSGTDLLFLGLESGTAATSTFRRLRLRLSGNQFYTEQQSGTSANTAVLLGTAKAGTTYIVEFDTAVDGSMTLYAYEKGKERSTGLKKVVAADAGWTAPKLYIQGNSGTGAIAGVVAIDNLAAQWRPTLTDMVNWSASLTDKTSWSRTDYIYDPLRGQLQSETTYASSDATTGAGYISPEWSDENWSDNYTQYIYDQSGNLLQKIDGAKVDAITYGDNSWALDQRKRLGIVYTVAGPNGGVGEGKKTVDLTTTDLALIASKASFNTVFVYDGLNRITKQTDPSGNVTLTTYDDASRTTKVELANGLTTTSTYDRSGTLLVQAQVDKAAPGTSLGSIEYTYDKMGRLTSTKVTSTGERTYILYDALGRKVGDIDAEGALTEYRYNNEDQLTRTVAYANKVSSAVLAALALDPSAATVPANQLANSLSGWTSTSSNAAKITSGLNTATANTSGTTTLAGDNTMWLKQLDADATLTSQLQSGNITLPTSGSRRFEVSAYVGVVNATATLSVQFFNVVPSNSTVPLSSMDIANTSATAGGANLSNYTRLAGYVDAPAGALYARVVVKKTATVAGQSSSLLYVTHPLLAQTAVSGTLSKPFAALDVRPVASATEDRGSWNIYDKAGRLAKTILVRGEGTSNTDEAGQVTEYRYDGAGRLTDTIAYATTLMQSTIGTMLGLTKLRSALGEVQAGDGTLTIDGTVYTQLLDAANDRRTRNFYSADGLLVGQLDGENYFTKNTYDGAGRLLSSTGYAQAITTVVPEGNTPPIPQVSFGSTGLDRTTRYYYNGRGQLVGMLDAELYYTAYQYDIGGNKMSETRYATQVVNAVGSGTIPSVVSIAPQDGKPYVVTNSEDHATRYFYDANNRLLRKQESPSGVVTSYEYNSVGKLTKSTVALGTVDERIAQKRYDAAGRVIAELGGVGSTKLVGLTDQSAIDIIWKTYGTQYLYDAGGRLTATITPDGSSATGLKTIFYYDKAGRMTHSINALGEVKQYTYNAFGEQSEVRGVATRVASTTLAGLAGGLNTSLTTGAVVTGISDSVTTMRYSRAGQLRQVEDAEKNVSNTSYNAFGEVFWSEPPWLNGNKRYFEYSYDRRGLVTQVADIDSVGGYGAYSSTSSQYNAFGQRTLSTDARGNVTFYAYDRLGRTYAVSDAGTWNFGVATSYDAFNRVVTQTDHSAKQTVTYIYDSINRKVTITTAEGAKASDTVPRPNSANTGLTFQSVQVLNREGQIVSVTDGRGGYTQYTYDADGHLTNTMVKNASTDTDAAALTSESNTYDSAGRISTTTNAMGGLTTITYDKVNRALTQTQTDGLGNTFKTQWRYDALGRAVWKQNAAGTWTQTSFDRNGRVKTVVVDPKSIPRLTLSATAPDIALNVNSAGLALTTQFDYDEQGHVISQTEGAGSSQPRKTQYKYDLRGRRQFEIVDPDGLALITEYVYDVNDNVVARLETKNASVKQTTRYVYDSSNRLSWQISATGAVTQTEYDAAGNISRLTAYAKLVDLTAADLQNLQGLTAALVSAKVGAPNASVDHVTRYVYDADNRLIFTIDSQGYGTRNEYDKAGNVVVATRYAAKIPMLADPGVVDGRVRFVVDMTALAALDADGKNQVDQYIYDGAHRVVGHVDAQGGYTLTEYRKANREVRTTRYANAVVYPTTPSAGTLKNRLIVNTPPATSSTAPVASNITVATVQMSSGSTGKDVVSYQWLDALGQVSGKQDGAGYVTTYMRDGMGRVVRTVDQSNNALFNVYDSAGRLTLATDALGTITKTSYDALGNVKETSLVEGGLPLDMGVIVGYGAKLARDLSASMGNINNGDTVTVNGWFKADDGVSAQMTLGNQAGTVQVSSATKSGVRNSDAAWQGFTLTYTHSSATPMALWLTMSGDTNVLHAGMDSDVLYDDLSVTVQRNGSTTQTQVLSDNFSNTDANAALTGYTVTGDVSRLQYQYLDGLNGQSISDAANSAGAVATHVTSYAYDNAGRLIEQTQAKGTTEQATTRYVLDKLGQREKVIDPRGIEAAEGNSAWAQAYRQSKLGYTSAPDKTTKALDYQKLLDDFTTTQVFDAQGRITQTKDPLGGTINTQFDAFGNAIRIQDPNGNYGHFFFNELNQATWQVDPLGYATETRFNSLGQVDSIVKYAKALKNWTAGTTSPAVPLNPDAVTAYKAANSGALPSGTYVEADALDATTTIGHDKLGRQTSIKDAMGFTESMVYDALGNKTSYTGKSNTSKTTDAVDPYKYEYDKRGLLIKETLPVKATKLDLLTGEPVSGASPVEVINKYEYDARGNKTKSIEAVGLQEERTTVFAYDQMNRQTARIGQAMSTYTVAGGEQSNQTPKETRSYDASGNLIEVKAADGGRTLSYYDQLNRKTVEVSPVGTLTTFAYDAVGNVLTQRVYGDAVTMPALAGGTAPAPANASNYRETTFKYDARNRQTEQSVTGVTVYSKDTVPSTQNLSTKTYTDASGNVVKVIDPRGNATFSYYDNLGRKVLQVDAERYVTQWAYDAVGNMLSQIRYANAIPVSAVATVDVVAVEASVSSLLAAIPSASDKRVVEYSYDRLNRKTEERSLGVLYTEVNASSGAPVEMTGTVSTKFEYNGLGGVTKQTKTSKADGTATTPSVTATLEVTDMSYDAQGRLTRTQAPTFVDWENASVRPTSDIEYNALGLQSRLIQRGKNDATEADDRITSYSYGKNGLRVAETDPQGNVTNYAFDVAQRITRRDITRKDADGTLNNDRLSVVYDLAGQQTEQITASKVAAATAYTQLKSEQTGYNVYGEVTLKGENGGAQRKIEYDNAGRVWRSNATDNGAVNAYYYDANGNATLELTSSTDDLKSIAILPDASGSSLNALLGTSKVLSS
jgi:YD repeat-containing protein